MTYLITSPATLLQLQGTLTPPIGPLPLAGFLRGIRIHLPTTYGKRTPRQRRRDRHREWQRRDRASRAGRAWCRHPYGFPLSPPLNIDSTPTCPVCGSRPC